MMEKRTPKAVLQELLALTPEEREVRTPVDGFEQVAKTYLDTAISEQDGGMLKYIFDLIEKGSSASSAKDEQQQKLDAFLKAASEAIDG